MFRRYSVLVIQYGFLWSNTNPADVVDISWNGCSCLIILIWVISVIHIVVYTWGGISSFDEEVVLYVWSVLWGLGCGSNIHASSRDEDAYKLRLPWIFLGANGAPGNILRNLTAVTDTVSLWCPCNDERVVELVFDIKYMPSCISILVISNPPDSIICPRSLGNMAREGFCHVQHRFMCGVISKRYPLFGHEFEG